MYWTVASIWQVIGVVELPGVRSEHGWTSLPTKFGQMLQQAATSLELA
jgi:hypothetical protein